MSMPHDPRTSHATEQDAVDPHGFDPDAEALRLAMKVIAHARVARSFARIAAGVVQESAKQASTVLRAYAGAALAARAAADVPEARPEAPAAPATAGIGFERFARAAAEAATEVTAEEVARILTALETMTAPRPAPAAPPPPSEPAASTTRIARDDAA